METEPEDPQAGVIDLAPISDACSDLVNWYDDQLRGAHPTVDELQPIVARLQELPPMPGRLGRDIDLVISGGGSNSRNDIVGAIERLRHVASYNNTPPGQKPLPGFESTDGSA